MVQRGPMHSDAAPGKVQRLRKTATARGVWAASRALVYHTDFPTLLGSTLQNRSAGLRFAYNWRQWLSNISASNALGVAISGMLHVLHFEYKYEQARINQLVPQLARTVIELEYRRSEKERRKQGIGYAHEDTETKIMSVVRAACTHKIDLVAEILARNIAFVFLRFVAGAQICGSSTGTNSNTIANANAIDRAAAPEGMIARSRRNSLAASTLAPAHTYTPEATIAICAPFTGTQPIRIVDEGGDVPGQLIATTVEEDIDLAISAAVAEANDFLCRQTDTTQSYTPPPPNTNLTDAPQILNNDDPLFGVVMLIRLGEEDAALEQFRLVLGCHDKNTVAENALSAGLPPWYYMWLCLGDLVLQRERKIQNSGREPTLTTTLLLASLDAIFAKIEHEREYGEFTPASTATLQDGIARGNFTAIATQGLLMLGGEAMNLQMDNALEGVDPVARERAGLGLVVNAMATDAWTVPRLLAQTLRSRGTSLQETTTAAAIASIRLRARGCGGCVAAVHVGELLDASGDSNGAKAAFRDCLTGVDIPVEIRLRCTRQLARLATFGAGGVGADSTEAIAMVSRGAEADDPLCLALLANLQLRAHQSNSAHALFLRMFQSHEREVYISAYQRIPRPQWETYRIFVVEQEEEKFLASVLQESCVPSSMSRELAHEFGDLMVIEIHEHGLP